MSYRYLIRGFCRDAKRLYPQSRSTESGLFSWVPETKRYVWTSGLYSPTTVFASSADELLKEMQRQWDISRKAREARENTKSFQSLATLPQSSGMIERYMQGYAQATAEAPKRLLPEPSGLPPKPAGTVTGRTDCSKANLAAHPRSVPSEPDYRRALVELYDEIVTYDIERHTILRRVMTALDFPEPAIQQKTMELFRGLRSSPYRHTGESAV